MGIQSSHFAHLSISILTYMSMNLPVCPSCNETRAFHPGCGMDKGRGVTYVRFIHFLFPLLRGNCQSFKAGGDCSRDNYDVHGENKNR